MKALPKLFFLALSAPILHGCAALEVKPNRNQDLISLEFVKPSKSGISTTYIYHDDYDCYGRKIISLPPSSSTTVEDTLSTIVTEQKKPYQTVRNNFFAMMGFPTGTATYTCDSAISFPTSGYKKFKIYMRGSAVSSCGLIAFGVDESSELHKIRLIKRETRNPYFDPNGPDCSANKEMVGSSNLITPRGTPKP